MWKYCSVLPASGPASAISFAPVSAKWASIAAALIVSISSPAGPGADALDHVAVQRVADAQHVPCAGRDVPGQVVAGRPRTCVRSTVRPRCQNDLAPASPARVALRCRAGQHGDVAIEALRAFSGCGRVRLTRPGPFTIVALPTSFFAACSVVTHGPPAFQPLHRFTLSAMPSRSASRRACLKSSRHARAHELPARAARRARPRRHRTTAPR